MDSLRKFRVILWKNFLVRKRHAFLTLVEIIIPIGLFFLVSYVRSKLPDFSKQYVNESTTVDPIPATDISTRLNIRELNVLYAPKTDFTKHLLRQVQLKLSLYNEGVQGFRSEGEVMSHYNKHDGEGMTAVILFAEVGNSVPMKLTYDIRIYKEYVFWNTDRLFQEIGEYVPGIGSETYRDKGFLPLQMALDTSFYEMVSKNGPSLSLMFQEFPYPPYTTDSGLRNMFILALPILTLFSFLFMFPSILKRVIEEKGSGIKELMKLNGLEPWMLWASWFMYGFVLNIVSVVAIVVFLKIELWDVPYPAVQYCDGVVLALYLLLFCSASITFCFLFSTMFNRPNVAMITGILFWIISYLVYSNLSGRMDVLSWGFKLPTLLFPNIALYHGYQAICMFELREIHLIFTNLFESPTGSSNDVSMGNILIMLMFDTVLFFVLTIYFDSVFPGPYGIKKKWYYPLEEAQRIFKCKRVSQGGVTSESDANPKIKIRNLKKTYGNKTVVDGLHMDIYEGQITGLLGHNGAGKTTTISILTGMIEATSGDVFVRRGENDYVNLRENFGDVRHMLSICPQHNLLFPDLTVFEHLMFSGMLRGSSSSIAHAQAVDLLQNKLHLFYKKNKLVHTLSGGMKRKLSLGMALMGDPEILILDEPTTGVDIEGRRELWDLILPCKKTKTIIITTHFMEEADHLADRIAIMDHGNLICYDTLMNLKLNEGYYLTVNRTLVGDKKVDDEVEEVTNKIRKFMGVFMAESVDGSTGDPSRFAYKYQLPNVEENRITVLQDKIQDESAEIRERYGTRGVFSSRVSHTSLEDIHRNDDSKAANKLETKSDGLFNNKDEGYYLIVEWMRVDDRQVNKEVEEVVKKIRNITGEFMGEYMAECDGTSTGNSSKFTYKYRLPYDEKGEITKLLGKIEDESAKIREHYGTRGVFSFRVSHTTLEDIFLSASTKATNAVDKKSDDIFTSKAAKGVVTTWQKFKILIRKRALFVWKKKLFFVVMVLVSSLIIGLVFILGGKGSTDTSKDGPTLNMDLNIYGETGVYYSTSGNHANKINEHYEHLLEQQRSVPMRVKHVEERIVRKGIENIAYYKQRMIAGAKFADDNGTEYINVMYSNKALHGAPISLNLIMNTVLRAFAGEEYSITASNTPLHSVVSKRAKFEQSGIVNQVIWFILFPLALLFIVSYIISFTHAEESSSIRKLQHICGVSPWLYWVTNLIWDVCYYFAAGLMSLVLLYILGWLLYVTFGVDVFGDYLFFGPQEFYMLLLLLVVYACSIPWAYWTSYVHKTVESAYSSYILLNISVFPILTICVLVMEYSTDKYYEQTSKTMRYSCAIFPQFSLTYMASKFAEKYMQNHDWDLKSDREKKLLCSYLSLPCCYPDSVECSAQRSYFSDLNHLWVTLVTTILLVVVLILSHDIYYQLKRAALFMCRDAILKPDKTTEDDKPKKGGVSVLNVHKIKQKYLTFKFWPRWKEIIKDISFEVLKGECVGLLGVNGAGKSTTFRILAREEKEVSGRIGSDVGAIFETMGYCPQHDALINDLTGRELLTVFAELRGEESPDKCVTEWFTALEMLEYADQRCGTYSGGNKRKLNTCLSLIGVPPLVILDEPTSGIDPKSRRIVLNVLDGIKRAQSSAIVMSSHSMDECDALCDELIIIKDGIVKRKGPIAQLQQDDSGFTVKIKLKSNQTQDVIDHNECKPLMQKVQPREGVITTVIDNLTGKQVKCEKIDEHQGFLHIRVEDTNWSGLFKHLEELKSERSDIEDYTISNTSLEALFLNVAKEPPEEKRKKVKRKCISLC